ncbi:MAG: hypothetical protein RMJ19_14520 [Gemmatales bacterium]|nr:hypothetical protein [Gemmatales bacterium]MDW8176885.1 hypothetical protein [Gemmatales bacterium]
MAKFSLILLEVALRAADEVSGAPPAGHAQQLLWLWLVLGGAVLLFAVIVSVARSWYLRHREQREIERELLAEFQEAVERGEMSPEEFARVRRLLVGRLTGEPRATHQAQVPPLSQLRPEDLPILEQQTYASPSSEPAAVPQENEGKTDSDSSSPQSSAAS